MTITFELPPDIADRLDQKAAQEGQDIVGFLRQLAVREAEDVGTASVTDLRKPGLHSGWYWIADDFDSPLPDSFWMGGEVHHALNGMVDLRNNAHSRQNNKF